MFTAVAGDFSPLAVDASGGLRHAPPTLVVAVAAGLASMDMPIPDVAAWEWQTWKFPRSVRAGDTIYARWTLTQKRAPLKGGRTAIAVWRVDVHTTDGTVCAEGEVGASVNRSGNANNRQAVAAATEAAPPGGAAAAPARRRRRGRRSGGAETATASPAAAPAPPPPAPQAHQERASSSRRRRRRRTSGQSNGGGDSAHTAPAEPTAPAPIEHAAAAAPAAPAARTGANPLTRVMKRLRGT